MIIRVPNICLQKHSLLLSFLENRNAFINCQGLSDTELKVWPILINARVIQSWWLISLVADLDVWGTIIAIFNCLNAMRVRSWILSHKIKTKTSLYLIFSENFLLTRQSFSDATRISGPWLRWQSEGWVCLSYSALDGLCMHIVTGTLSQEPHTVLKVTWVVARGTGGILLKSCSLHWVLLHLHIQSARWQARINFHKKETASHLQTIVQASALIFELGVDSHHLGQEPAGGIWLKSFSYKKLI